MLGQRVSLHYSDPKPKINEDWLCAKVGGLGGAKGGDLGGSWVGSKGVLGGPGNILRGVMGMLGGG